MFVYGWNVPGYMPDTVEAAETWVEARDALLWEVERWDALEEDSEAALGDAERTIKAAPHGVEFEVQCGRYVLFVARRERD